VRKAFEQYIRRNADMPAPADIVNIIDPPPPKIDWPLYVSLKKKVRDGNYYLSLDERKFIKNCEDIAILRQQGEVADYHRARNALDDDD
jgi:hypothetical protein